MFEWDDTQAHDASSSLEVVVAREREAPVERAREIRVAHAHGLRDLLARERPRRITPPDEAPGAPLDAVA
jgi:hypothetical protein